MHVTILEADERFPVDAETIESLKCYANNGVMPEPFLRAVLENDLTEAVGYSNSKELANLKNIVCYVFYWVPSQLRGSRKTVESWSEFVIGLKKKINA